MKYPLSMANRNLLGSHKNWGWFLLWGIILIILGCAAMSYSAFATIISVIVLGLIMGASGIVIMLDACQFWRQNWGAFFAHLIMGILYLIFGILLIKLPILAEISLTLLLAIFYMIIGIYRIIYSLYYQTSQKGWRIFNGALSLLIGIFILAEWPLSGVFILGLFIGIDLFFSGFTYIMAALSLRTLPKN